MAANTAFSGACASMGGALALQLAALETGRIKGLATLNAPVLLDRPRFARELMDGAAPDRLSSWDGAPFVGPPASEITCPGRGRKSGVDLLAMAVPAREAPPLVAAPILVLQSVDDHVVPKRNAEVILAGVGSAAKSIEWLHRSYHMAQFDRGAAAQTGSRRASAPRGPPATGRAP